MLHDVDESLRRDWRATLLTQGSECEYLLVRVTRGMGVLYFPFGLCFNHEHAISVTAYRYACR